MPDNATSKAVPESAPASKIAAPPLSEQTHEMSSPLSMNDIAFIQQCLSNVVGIKNDGIYVDCVAVQKLRGQTNPRSVGLRINTMRKKSGLRLVGHNSTGENKTDFKASWPMSEPPSAQEGDELKESASLETCTIADLEVQRAGLSAQLAALNDEIEIRKEVQRGTKEIMREEERLRVKQEDLRKKKEGLRVKAEETMKSKRKAKTDGEGGGGDMKREKKEGLRVKAEETMKSKRKAKTDEEGGGGDMKREKRE